MNQHVSLITQHNWYRIDIDIFWLNNILKSFFANLPTSQLFLIIDSTSIHRSQTSHTHSKEWRWKMFSCSSRKEWLVMKGSNSKNSFSLSLRLVFLPSLERDREREKEMRTEREEETFFPSYSHFRFSTRSLSIPSKFPPFLPLKVIVLRIVLLPLSLSLLFYLDPICLRILLPSTHFSWKASRTELCIGDGMMGKRGGASTYILGFIPSFRWKDLLWVMDQREREDRSQKDKKTKKERESRREGGSERTIPVHNCPLHHRHSFSTCHLQISLSSLSSPEGLDVFEPSRATKTSLLSLYDLSFIPPLGFW